MTSPDPTCEHLAAIAGAHHQPHDLCEECLSADGCWVSLRVCLTCGHVGCAEGSPGDHAAQHYAETDHPIAATVGSQPARRWCYPDGRSV
jgi:uncharacterized UBP type Zn finger protein